MSGYKYKEQYIAPLFQLRAEYGYNHVAVPFVKEAQAIYENRKKELGVLNFQDLLIKATDLLREHPEVRRYFQSKYKALLVDEFQDTDPIQAKMLMYLTSQELSEKRWDRITPIPGSLFVVGDPKQSIYGFRRADIDIYHKFRSRILETGGQRLLLTTNFRSVKELGSWFNGKFNQIFRTDGKQAMYSDADTIRESLPGTFSGVGSYKIDASNASAIAAVEPAGIARLIQYIVTHQSLTEGTDVLTQRPVQYRDIMVLFLKKNVLTRYGKELSELGIPVKTTGADVVTRTPQFQALADIIRMLAYPEENALLYKVLQGPAFGFTDQELFRFHELGGHFNIYADLDRVLLLLQPEHEDYRLLVRIRDAYRLLRTFAFYMRKMVPAAATERIITDLGMTARMLESRKSVTEIGSFVSLIEKIRLNKLTNVWDLNQFVEEIQAMVGSGYEEEIDLEEDQFNAVQMMNLHKAKGLEAPIVILASPCGGKIKEPKFYVARSIEELKPENLEVELAQGEALTAVSGDPDEERAWGITRIKLSTNFWSKEYIQPAAWGRIQEAAMGKQEAEQVRLLYVAATRAQNALIISDSASKENYWSGLLDGKEKEIDREIAEAGFQFTPPSRLDESDELEAAAELTLEKILQRTDAAFSHFESTYEMFTPSEKVKKGSVVEPLEGMELDPDLILLNSMEVYIEGDREVFRTLRTQLGTAIHKILEGVIRGGRNIDQLISFVAKQIDKKEVSEQLLRDVADTFVTSSLYRRVQAAQEVYTEVPITVRVPAGSSFAGNQFDKDCYINGSIDLVLREGDGWTIVDYKTCASTEVKQDLAVKYQPQLDAYKQAWELATGEQVAKTEIFFIEKS